MEDDVHEVVKLLAARMKSHPEEFGPNSDGRWDVFINLLIPFTTPEERLLLRGPRMKMLHELVLNELLNGSERRTPKSKSRTIPLYTAESLRLMKEASKL